MEQIGSWDFKEVNTKEYTHGFHTYPAMMIPQIARRLLNLYGKNAKVLLDPFMGSGTSLVEASLTHNIEKVYGFDLNPLAVLMSTVKTTPLEKDILEKELDKILYSEESTFQPPTFKNIEFWFKPEIIKNLSILKKQINKIQEEHIRNFFLLAFSETVRNCSNTRKKEFKLYRESKEKLKRHNPNVLEEFKRISLKNVDSLERYKRVRNGTKVYSMLRDIREEIPLNTNSVDLIITSPPYGDSQTTVAYGQFSRLSLQWLDYQDANKVDKNLLGGITCENLNINIDSPHLKEVIFKISQIDQKRAKEVLSFYKDFNKGLYELDRVMKRGGYICFVVGNRTVKGINIPTNKIMIEMFKALGNYRHIVTYHRKIPNKRMPRINSPTNKKGQTTSTINNEFIFILRKE